MCGSKPRHLYFAIKILQAIPQSLVLIEAHYQTTAKNYVKTISPLMARHFQEFAAAEKKYFQAFVKKHRQLLKSRLFAKIKPGAINDPLVVARIKALNPQLIAVHSTSLIKAELIEAFPQRIINLHAGLSPYYRGSGTNVWPFYNQELQYVGMTVHYLDIGIDSGAIILQGRPKFSPADNTHTIGCKNIILGTELMIKVLQDYLRFGPPPGIPQEKVKGKLYLKKDFNDQVILKIQRLLKAGLVKKYA